MLLITIFAMLTYSLVVARCGWFVWQGGDYRQDDRAEVAHIVCASLLYLVTLVSLWVFEPWKLINNSIVGAMVLAHTIFCGSYFYRRIGALMDGRDRRKLPHRRASRANP